MATIRARTINALVSSLSSAAIMCASKMETRPRVSLALGVAAGLGLGCAYVFGQSKDQMLSALLDEEESQLAIELVEVDEATLRSDTPVGVVADEHEVALGIVPYVPAIEPPQVAATALVGVAEYNHAPVATDLHRNVARRNRRKYCNLVVAECKVQFGTPRRTVANKLAVRRTAVKLMKSHGVRPSHINVMIPKIVELVFLPNKHELAAAKMAARPDAWRRVLQLAQLEGMSPSGWAEACK